jgi:hypothetical protein
MNLNDTQQRLLRALIAAQVAVLEWGSADVADNQATAGLDASLKEALKLAKRLRQA